MLNITANHSNQMAPVHIIFTLLYLSLYCWCFRLVCLPICNRRSTGTTKQAWTSIVNIETMLSHAGKVTPWSRSNKSIGFSPLGNRLSAFASIFTSVRTNVIDRSLFIVQSAKWLLNIRDRYDRINSTGHNGSRVGFNLHFWSGWFRNGSWHQAYLCPQKTTQHRPIGGRRAISSQCRLLRHDWRKVKHRQHHSHASLILDLFKVFSIQVLILRTLFVNQLGWIYKVHYKFAFRSHSMGFLIFRLKSQLEL